MPTLRKAAERARVDWIVRHPLALASSKIATSAEETSEVLIYPNLWGIVIPMSFIQRELDRLSAALRADPQSNDYDRLYAAQQALSWATDPDGFASPMKHIRGIQGDSGDCSDVPRPIGS